MSSKDTIIILASVGTTIIRAKVTTYDMIKRDLADYSGMEVLQVFTDDNAAHAMSEPEDRVYTVEEALEKAIALGYSKVIAVPVFMTKGELYNSLKSRLDFYLDRLEITMTDSVLHDAQSCRVAVCAAGTVIILIHGKCLNSLLTGRAQKTRRRQKKSPFRPGAYRLSGQ